VNSFLQKLTAGSFQTLVSTMYIPEDSHLRKKLRFQRLKLTKNKTQTLLCRECFTYFDENTGYE